VKQWFSYSPLFLSPSRARDFVEIDTPPKKEENREITVSLLSLPSRGAVSVFFKCLL
jgi:hypothetical protein